MSAVLRAQVLDWMASHEASATAAVDHFFPHSTPNERKRHLGAIRQWTHRARRGQIEAPDRIALAVPSPTLDLPPPPERSQRAGARVFDIEIVWEPDPSVVTDSLIDDLTRQAARLAGDATALRAARRYDQAARVEGQLRDVRTEIESARRAASSQIRIERTPAAIATEIERHRRTIELAAELERRKLARGRVL